MSLHLKWVILFIISWTLILSSACKNAQLDNMMIITHISGINTKENDTQRRRGSSTTQKEMTFIPLGVMNVMQGQHHLLKPKKWTCSFLIQVLFCVITGVYFSVSKGQRRLSLNLRLMKLTAVCVGAPSDREENTKAYFFIFVVMCFYKFYYIKYIFIYIFSGMVEDGGGGALLHLWDFTSVGVSYYLQLNVLCPNRLNEALWFVWRLAVRSSPF